MLLPEWQVLHDIFVRSCSLDIYLKFSNTLPKNNSRPSRFNRIGDESCDDEELGF
jgi:hypothetical protein